MEVINFPASQSIALFSSKSSTVCVGYPHFLIKNNTKPRYHVHSSSPCALHSIFLDADPQKVAIENFFMIFFLLRLTKSNHSNTKNALRT
jgi:hypothetical protein